MIITQHDLTDALKSLKSCGPDLVSPRLLKEGALFLVNPFTIVFNHSLQQGYFPSGWKDPNLTPIHKTDDKSNTGNFRPISLLSPSDKVIEGCVHKHLYNYNLLATKF